MLQEANTSDGPRTHRQDIWSVLHHPMVSCHHTDVAVADHKKKEVTVFSLDRAVQSLEEAMDWPKIQKLVLAKTVPQKAGMEEDGEEEPAEEMDTTERDNLSSPDARVSEIPQTVPS